MNKVENIYKIKKWRDSAKEAITSVPPRTDNQSDSNPKIVNYALIPNTCRTKSISNPSSIQQANINPGLS